MKGVVVMGERKVVMQFYRVFRCGHILKMAVLAVFLMSCSSVSAKADDKETLQLLDLFGDVFEKVKQDYVEEVPDEKLIEAAINGMLTSLDPHSGYLNDKAFDEMKVQTRGEFGGLGIEVTLEGGLIKVVSPIDDTPAYHAGIHAGDYISHIDNEAVTGMTLNEAVDKMRGKPGTKVIITVLREGEAEPIDIPIIRDVIKIKSVRGEREGDVAYIRITSFSEQTAGMLKKEFLKQKKEIGKDLKGLVLDLRNNPGGLLDQAIEVSDAFLDQGEIVSTRGREKESTKRVNARKGDITDGLPIVVLINSGSASASEIVAGALQDHARAVVMGTRSFGKGSVQTVIPLPGNRAMRLTTSRYYTPSGRSIQAEGITPDIEVEMAKVESVQTQKRRFTEANLPGHLVNGDSKKTTTPKNLPEVKKDGKDKEEKTLDERDYQLARAVDLLHGIYVYRNGSRGEAADIAKQAN